MTTLTNYQKAFLKWPGGKSSLLPKLLPLLENKKRLLEPFAGSGVVFLNSPTAECVINDINTDLMNLYKILKKEKKAFIDYAKTFSDPKNNQSEKYYAFRELFNTTSDLRLRAALFIYFNRHGFNGLCRYNSKGKFNVPFGSYKNPMFPEEALYAVAKKLQKTSIMHDDYKNVLALATEDDVVYCDPPYAPLSDTAFFTAYSGNIFNEQHHIELAQYAEKLAKRGITVIISNHATPFTLKLYKKASIEQFLVARSISVNYDNRQPVTELLAVFS